MTCNNGVDWNQLPREVITEIYSYLGRRDRLACSMVCQNWSNALYTPMLWRDMVVYIDTDLMEPSTLLMTRQFFMYMETLELGWANPQLPPRWMQQSFPEITKRTCRYLMILFECLVQLRTIKLVDWYQIVRFKKIIYHLSRFLKTQKNLVEVSFYNMNLNKADCIQLLASCLGSEKTITHINIFSCYQQQNLIFESVQFLSCIERLSNLLVLKLDYSALSKGIIEAILTSKNKGLQLMDISIKENDSVNQSISEQSWENLKNQCPQLKVAMHMNNICHYDKISPFLKEAVPLATFSLFCGKNWDQTISRSYRKTLNLLLKNYRKSLENVSLYLRNNAEKIDDLVISFLKRCPKLERFDFNGKVENMELIGDVCKLQIQKEIDFRFYYLRPTNITFDNFVMLNNTYIQYGKALKEQKVDLRIFNDYEHSKILLYY